MKYIGLLVFLSSCISVSYANQNNNLDAVCRLKGGAIRALAIDRDNAVPYQVEYQKIMRVAKGNKGVRNFVLSWINSVYQHPEASPDQYEAVVETQCLLAG